MYLQCQCLSCKHWCKLHSSTLISNFSRCCHVQEAHEFLITHFWAISKITTSFPRYSTFYFCVCVRVSVAAIRNCLGFFGILEGNASQHLWGLMPFDIRWPTGSAST
jgi:hypothetical protein